MSGITNPNGKRPWGPIHEVPLDQVPQRRRSPWVELYDDLFARLSGTPRYAFQVNFDTPQSAMSAAEALRAISRKRGGLMQIAQRRSVLYISRSDTWPSDQLATPLPRKRGRPRRR